MAGDGDSVTAEGQDGSPDSTAGRRLGVLAGHEDALADLCRRAVSELAFSRCEALVRERLAGVVRVLAGWDRDVGADPLVPASRGALAESEVATIAATERAVTCRYHDDSELTAEQRAEMDRQGACAAVVAPIFSGAEVVGFLAGLRREQTHSFTRAETLAFADLAATAASPLAGAQLLHELRRKNMGVELLAGVAREVASAHELDALLAIIGAHLLVALGASRCSLFELDGEACELVAVAHHRAADAQFDTEALSHRMDEKQWPRGHRALEAGGPTIQYHEVARGSEEFGCAEPLNERATLTAPLLWRGAALGVIDVAECRYARRFTEEEVLFAATAATLAAGAVADRRLRALLRRQATIDELTGLQNRRAFMARLEESLAQAGRYGSTLTLLMVDVDDLTLFNDTYGHAQGDRLLQSLASLLRRGVRTNIDMVARYGGEEFVLLLPHTAVDGAMTAADRLQGSLIGEATSVAEALRAATESYRFDGQSGIDASMTVSIGVACYPEHGTTALDLLMAADRALYAAKRLGKNQVRVYEG
jgi:diguanylate cyclase (GGDEF)-like protein